MGNMTIDRNQLSKYVQNLNATLISAHEKAGLEPIIGFQDSIVWRQEQNKARIAFKARTILDLDSWTMSDFGKGEILNKVLSALSVPNNNLISRYSIEALKQQSPEFINQYEQSLYDIYCGPDDEEAFNHAVQVLGNHFPLISFLFFVKDPSIYITVNSRNFYKRFNDIGINLEYVKECSWNNYRKILNLFEELRLFLVDYFSDPSINIHMARAFLWIGWCLHSSESTLLGTLKKSYSNDFKEEQKIIGRIKKIRNDTSFINENERIDDECQRVICNDMLKTIPDDHISEHIKPKPAVYMDRKKKSSIPVRNPAVAIRALRHANYKCEIDHEHKTFIRKNSDIPYTESHHLVPMCYSSEYKYSLDTEVNIVSLCSNCHNQIHYGVGGENLIKKLYSKRANLLLQAGIEIDERILLKMYGY